MTEYGMFIRNENSRIQIDSKYRNLSYSSSGTVTITSANTNYDIDFTDTTDMPWVGIRPVTGGYCLLTSLVKSGSNYTKATIRADTGSLTVPYIIYSEGLKNSTSTGYGLVVYNSSGTVVYSSNEDCYLQVVGRYFVPAIMPNDPGGYIPAEADVVVSSVDNNYFFLSQGLSGCVYDGQTNDRKELWRIAMKKIDSTTIRFKQIMSYSVGISHDGTYQEALSAGSLETILIEAKKPPGI